MASHMLRSARCGSHGKGNTVILFACHAPVPCLIILNAQIVD